MKKIIGLTGPLASGCTSVAKELSKNGYTNISISNDVLKKLSEKYKKPFRTREEKQTFGNLIRRKYRKEFEQVLLKIIEQIEGNVVIECFRNPIEIDVFRNKYTSFFLFALYTTKSERNNRYTENDFEKSDERDQGEDDKYGQQVRKCVNQADVVINNSTDWLVDNNLNDFFKKIDTFIELLETPTRGPSREETNMHLAYSISLQSSCLQRQVGAVITDDSYNVLSMGYNDVPLKSVHCHKNSNCYRKIKNTEHLQNICNNINKCPNCGNTLKVEDGLLISEPKFAISKKFICQDCDFDLSELVVSKNLDYCRSLHAEENAILSNPFLTRKENLILFTTTFPCMLCAKKIANSGIKKIIFVEPYPVKESETVLKENDIDFVIFEGIKSLKFNWIFRDRRKHLNNVIKNRNDKLKDRKVLV